MTVPIAYSLDDAVRVTGVPGRLVRRWDTLDAVAPSIARLSRRLPHGRIYSLRDLVALRALFDLGERFELSERDLKRVGRWLARHPETPWSDLRLFVVGKAISFDPPGSPTGDEAVTVVELAPVAAAVESAARSIMDRRPEQIGRVVRHPHVLHNKPVLAGTRVPTSAVYSFHRAGHGLERILEAYPDLTPEDVAAAIAFEQGRQSRSPRSAA
jgi:uncharacterized protein (DUF433 family)